MAALCTMLHANSSASNRLVASLVAADEFDVNRLDTSILTALLTMLFAYSSASNRLVASLALVAALRTMIFADYSDVNQLVTSIVTELLTMMFAYFSNVNRLVESIMTALLTIRGSSRSGYEPIFSEFFDSCKKTEKTFARKSKKSN